MSFVEIFPGKIIKKDTINSIEKYKTWDLDGDLKDLYCIKVELNKPIPFTFKNKIETCFYKKNNRNELYDNIKNELNKKK